MKKLVLLFTVLVWLVGRTGSYQGFIHALNR